MWGSERGDQVERLLFGDNSSIVDTAQNMVALSPLLHHWWGEGTIAFEPIHRLPKGVRLMFRWLKNPPARLGDTIPLDTDPRRDVSRSHDGGSTSLRHLDSGRLILDGKIIDIVSEDPMAIPSFEVFQLQWDLLRIARLSGAAEAAKDPSDPDPGGFMLDIMISVEEEAERPRSQSPRGGDLGESSTKGEGKPSDIKQEAGPGGIEARETEHGASTTGEGPSTPTGKGKSGPFGS